MTVSQFDNSARWVVQSGDKRYLCDISAHDGNGQCNCQHFQIHLRTLVKSGEINRCKHLHKVFFVVRGEGSDPDPEASPTMPLLQS
jgi:hypothetical protein